MVLEAAHRRPLSPASDRAAEQTTGVAPRERDPNYEQHPAYYNIRGNYLVIQYANVKTLNVEYIFLTPTSLGNDDTPPPEVS